jgi:release factor glutamine methyltransferase
MKSRAWLKQAQHHLETAGIGTARLDALVLLEDIAGRDRAWLLAHPDFELSAAQTAKLKNLLNRRARHEPLAYIRGRAEFYGREFVLTPAVLQPRPESEAMIDVLKALPHLAPTVEKKRTQPRIADVGTGSGALGITAALELPNAAVELLDIDSQALKIAQINVDKFTLRLSIIRSDLLNATKAAYDLLLCNLPYIPNNYIVNKSAALEPKIAIFGGLDGLDVYRKLFAQVTERSQKPLYILTEALPPQHAVLARIAATAGYIQCVENDFIQAFARIQK